LSKIIIRTETWNTRSGKIVKAVARDNDGRIIGATNQTNGVSVDPFSLVGSK
jgi:hypothetical protein